MTKVEVSITHGNSSVGPHRACALMATIQKIRNSKLLVRTRHRLKVGPPFRVAAQLSTRQTLLVP